MLKLSRLLVAASLLACTASPAPSDDAANVDASSADAAADTGHDGGAGIDAAQGADAGACDADHDGATATSCGGSDCDDADPMRFPGNPEVCDAAGHDEDCNPATFGTRDMDGDGHIDAACCNTQGTTQNCGDDCDDSHADVYAGLVESCDGLDNDCDSATDEGVRTTFYRDADGDGYGVPGTTMSACTRPLGYAPTSDDCDDTNGAINPAAAEQCDAPAGTGVDEDCDGVPNEGCVCGDGSSIRCDDPSLGADVLRGACAAGMRACVAGQWTMCSIVPVTEVCNHSDDDCDGFIDEGVTHVTCYDDPDDDGYPASTVTMGTSACPDPTRSSVGGCPIGLTNRPPITGNIDCLPLNSAAHPGVTAFTSTPACTDPTMFVACSIAGIWYCVPQSMPTCTTSAPLASFDFDCDGTLTREAAQTCAASGSACSTSCGADGYSYTTPPACGSSVDFVTCGGCGGGTCGATTSAPQPIGCR